MIMHLIIICIHFKIVGNNCNLLKYIGNFKTVEIKVTLKAIIVQCDKTNKSHNVFLVKHEENFKFSHSYLAYLYYRIDISFFFILKKKSH